MREGIKGAPRREGTEGEPRIEGTEGVNQKRGFRRGDPGG